MRKTVALVQHWWDVRGVPRAADAAWQVTAREPLDAEEAQPTYYYDITIDGKLLRHNQEATLERGIGWPAGRYKFCYAEQREDGSWMLMFFGPVRRAKQRYRQVWRVGAAVRTIHR